ncbi:hypothetical protein J2Z31_000008 [Sinorhizobium kostiense]|nr:hypothetical protein [Sinorhizobium kostiense]
MRWVSATGWLRAPGPGPTLSLPVRTHWQVWNIPSPPLVSGVEGASKMNQIIYLVGLVVIVIAILSFFGLS